MRSFVTTAEVAKMLDLSSYSFRRIRARLEDEEGFPEPMPHARRPLMWRRDQVQLWLDSRGLPRAPDTAPRIDPALIATGRVALLAEARRP